VERCHPQVGAGAVPEPQTLQAGLAVAAGENVADVHLREMWAALEEGLPRLGAGSAAAAAAEMLCHLLQGRLGARLPTGPRYTQRLEPLAAELHAMLGSTPAGDRRAEWFALASACTRLYTNPEEPPRYRLLAQQWARRPVAAGAPAAWPFRGIVA